MSDAEQMKTVAGVVLLLLGASLFLLLFFGATKTETVIDISFALQPGDKYEPPNNGTLHHTHVISKTALTGEILVEGGGVNFTAYGYNTQHLQNVLISQSYSFAINPAHDLYTFTFDNAGGSIQSSVKFTLKETWTDLFSLLIACITLMALVTTGTVLIVVGFRKKRA